MADRLTTAQRSANMAAIRGRDTAPELAVRRALRAHGVGYRLHVRGTHDTHQSHIVRILRARADWRTRK